MNLSFLTFRTDLSFSTAVSGTKFFDVHELKFFDVREPKFFDVRLNLSFFVLSLSFFVSVD